MIYNFLGRYIGKDKIGIRQYHFYDIADESPNFREIEKSNGNSLSGICCGIIYRTVFYASFGANYDFSKSKYFLTVRVVSPDAYDMLHIHVVLLLAHTISVPSK